ncbi:MAG: lysylphosphatidylglycerol synthase transmembrane domain-containing protein [Anaerolineales bacterium]|jgi:uncharacterized protein (TIRG00374 family)
METKEKSGRPWVRVLVIGLIIVAFLIFFDVEEVLGYIRNADWGYLGLAVVAILVGYLLTGVRWRHLLGRRPTLRFTFDTMNVSNMSNLMTFIPVTAIRAVLMGENKEVTIPQATSSLSIAIILDWIIKIIALLGAIMITLGTATSGNIFLISGVIIVVIIGAILLLVANAEKVVARGVPLLTRLPFLSEEQSQGIMTGLMEGLQGVGSARQLLVAFAWTILAWIFGLSFLYLGLLAMGVDMSAEQRLAAVLFAAVFVNPFSPYLPGVYNALLVASMYIVTRADVEALIAYSIVLYAVMLIIWFGLGTLGLRGLNLKFSKLREQISHSIDQMRSKEGEAEEASQEA